MACRHVWVATPRAKQESIMLPGELIPQRCQLCNTRYPCAGRCGHLDCITERGDPLPFWIGEGKENP
jgi:hypothetical protein